MKDIPFKVVESRQIYDRQVEGLSIIGTSYAVVVFICQSFPNPGYSMGISRVVKDGDIYSIYLSVVSPKPNYILPQVITYKSIGIEIDKEDLNPPYRFELVIEGHRGFVIRDDRKEY